MIEPYRKTILSPQANLESCVIDKVWNIDTKQDFFQTLNGKAFFCSVDCHDTGRFLPFSAEETLFYRYKHYMMDSLWLE
jgi:hypothetical protein